jgi:hypothetical protein
MRASIKHRHKHRHWSHWTRRQNRMIEYIITYTGVVADTIHTLDTWHTFNMKRRCYIGMHTRPITLCRCRKRKQRWCVLQFSLDNAIIDSTLWHWNHFAMKWLLDFKLAYLYYQNQYFTGTNTDTNTTPTLIYRHR